MDGYYLIDSIGSVNYDNLTTLGKKFHGVNYGNYTGNDYACLSWWASLNHSIFVTSLTSPFVITIDDKYWGDNYYLYFDSVGNVIFLILSMMVLLQISVWFVQVIV